MVKPKFRYNWKLKKWSEIFRFDPRPIIVTGVINPKTGLYKCHRGIPGVDYG